MANAKLPTANGRNKITACPWVAGFSRPRADHKGKPLVEGGRVRGIKANRTGL